MVAHLKVRTVVGLCDVERRNVPANSRIGNAAEIRRMCRIRRINSMTSRATNYQNMQRFREQNPYIESSLPPSYHEVMLQSNNATLSSYVPNHHVPMEPPYSTRGIYTISYSVQPTTSTVQHTLSTRPGEGAVPSRNCEIHAPD